MLEREPLRPAVAWGGSGTVTSTIGFSIVRNWLETASVVLAKETPDVRLINATEGGARIEGFEECTLADLLATLPDREITAASIVRDAERAQTPPSSERLAGWCREHAGLAGKVRHAARRIARLGEATLVALDRNEAKKISKGFEKLDIAELALKEAVARMPFVDSWIHADVQRVAEANDLKANGRDNKDSAQSSVSLELSLARVIEDGASELEQRLRAMAEQFGTPCAAPRADRPKISDMNDSCSKK
jgi:hypothetical protein